MLFQAQNFTFDLASHTHLMGIVNVTPDSFSDGGKFNDSVSAIQRGTELYEQGADIIDIGGESTRPGAEPVPLDQELQRVLPVVEALSRQGIPVSIDTYKSEVALQAVQSGACIINDISGLKFDPRIATIAAEANTGLVIMHIKGQPGNMQNNPQYLDLLGEISAYLRQSAVAAMNQGLPRQNIVLDPGIGFGKNLEHNLEIIRHLREFKRFGFPVLVGPSRKTFIGKILDKNVGQRLYGTIGACIAAVENGADILRVHDVLEVKEAVKVARAILEKPALEPVY